MLSLLGGKTTLCDRVSRRELMRTGGVSLLGSMTLPRLLEAASRDPARRHAAKAKSVIMFNLLGGPSHMDMFDMKPDAPAEIRGEFLPISTSVPGIHISEHLPRDSSVDAQGDLAAHLQSQLQFARPVADHDGLH